MEHLGAKLFISKEGAVNNNIGCASPQKIIVS